MLNAPAGLPVRSAIFSSSLASISVICHVLDAYLLHAEAALETVSTIFYLSNEGISILENVGKLGVPLPQKVQTLLSYLKKSGDNDPPS